MKLTVDVVVLRLSPGENPQPQVLLIEHGKEPFQGKWALPGGHVNDDESTIDGARRELQEETGLSAQNLRFLGLADKPNRDPRGRYVSAVYRDVLPIGDHGDGLRAGDDARNAQWFDICPGCLRPYNSTHGDIEIAFDHAEWIAAAMISIRRKASVAGMIQGLDDLIKLIGLGGEPEEESDTPQADTTPAEP
jgi:8-oxo-dGTP diphosphatase